MVPPLAIAQVCADPGIAPGATKGAAQHLRGIAAGLEAGGHRVTTFTHRRPESGWPTSLRRLRELSTAAVSEHDLVYERYSLGHLDALRLARDADRPFVLEVNAPLVEEALAHRPGTVGPRDARAEAIIIEEADLVITVSDALTAWAAERRAGPIVTIRNGFEPDWFADPAPRYPTPTLIFLGHPKPWHGADRLPGLLCRLADQGLRPRLLVIGGGPGAEVVANHATRLGVVDQIAITGALPPRRASQLLGAGVIGLAPYPDIDPFYFCPLKVVDYLAAGLPVVGSHLGDIPELIGDAGITVAASDDDALAHAVAALLRDPTRARALGESGRRRAQRDMAWNAVAERTLEAIDHLLPTSSALP